MMVSLYFIPLVGAAQCTCHSQGVEVNCAEEYQRKNILQSANIEKMIFFISISISKIIVCRYYIYLSYIFKGI